jgi:hypothetical protein
MSPARFQASLLGTPPAPSAAREAVMEKTSVAITVLGFALMIVGVGLVVVG